MDGGCTVSARCYHSQKKNEEAHKLLLSISETDDIILSITCSCVKGQSEACGHAIGLLYQLAQYKMEGRKAIPQDVAKTSIPQTWHKPRGEKLKGDEVQNLTFVGYSKKHVPGSSQTGEKKAGIKSTLYNPIRRDLPPLTDLHDSLFAVYPESMVLPSITPREPIACVKTKFGEFPKGSAIASQQKLHHDFVINVYDGVSFPNLPVENYMINSYNVSEEDNLAIDTVKLSPNEVHLLEEQTRLQSQSALWHKLRSNRITASKLHRIKTRQKDFEVLVKSMRSTSHRTTKAMADGLADEPKAAECYVQTSLENVNIYPCGIVISPWSPWLAVSPDRKVYNPNNNPPFGLLEIKCPRVESVLECSRYLANIDGILRLKPSHEYYTQIQAQLAVTGLTWCDFFVWCQNDNHKEKILFDPLF